MLCDEPQTNARHSPRRSSPRHVRARVDEAATGWLDARATGRLHRGAGGGRVRGRGVQARRDGDQFGLCAAPARRCARLSPRVGGRAGRRDRAIVRCGVRARDQRGGDAGVLQGRTGRGTDAPRREAGDVPAALPRPGPLRRLDQPVARRTAPRRRGGRAGRGDRCDREGGGPAALAGRARPSLCRGARTGCGERPPRRGQSVRHLPRDGRRKPTRRSSRCCARSSRDGSPTPTGRVVRPLWIPATGARAARGVPRRATGSRRHSRARGHRAAPRGVVPAATRGDGPNASRGIGTGRTILCPRRGSSVARKSSRTTAPGGCVRLRPARSPANMGRTGRTGRRGGRGRESARRRAERGNPGRGSLVQRRNPQSATRRPGDEDGGTTR